MQKITYMGNTVWPKPPKEQPRATNGKYVSRFFRRFINTLKIVLFRSAIVCALGWLAFGVHTFDQYQSSHELVYAATVDNVPSVSLASIKLEGKSVDQLEDEVIDQLAKNENENGLPAYLDDNKAGTLPKKDKLSYGCLSYKLSTVERHYKAINGAPINDLDAALLALDCPQAKALAKEAIFGKLDAVNEWMGATDKMAMKVEILRDMAK